jgi:hypothetical protein
MGGTKIDRGYNLSRGWERVAYYVIDPDGSDLQRFFQHFKEELKDQIRGTPKK